MEFSKKWYVQLALALLAAGILAVALILLDQKEMGEVIFSDNVPGSLGETKVMSIDLESLPRSRSAKIRRSHPAAAGFQRRPCPQGP